MFYKVDKNTEIGKQLVKLQEEMKVCHNAAIELTEKFGGTGYAGKMFCVAGGIRAIAAPSKPKGWKKTGREGTYIVGERAKEDKKLIEALPVVTNDQLNTIISYTEFEKPTDFGSYHVTYRPSIQWLEDCIVFKVSEEDPYKPTSSGIQEITKSEYELLTAKD